MTSDQTWSSALRRFDALLTSRVTSHESECCIAAQRAVWAEFLHHRSVGLRLAAIPEVLVWTPLAWPVTWCQLLTDDGLVGDCGVHAHVASLVLQSVQVLHVRVSVAIAPAPLHYEHWHHMWSSAGVSQTWLGYPLVYHEVLRVGSRFWDPSEARWFNERNPQLECGRVVALRVEGSSWREISKRVPV